MSITVRSAYGAEEGDAVSICYTDSLWTTQARRENLVYSKVKNCQNISTQFNSFMMFRIFYVPVTDVKIPQKMKLT